MQATSENQTAIEEAAAELQSKSLTTTRPSQLNKDLLEKELAQLKKKEGKKRHRSRSRSRSLSPRSRALARAQQRTNQEAADGEADDGDEEQRSKIDKSKLEESRREYATLRASLLTFKQDKMGTNFDENNIDV